MDLKAVYEKTEKGLSELGTRAFKLPARERSMLILVDGRRTGEQIVAQGRHFGDAEQFFAHLLDNGFIAASKTAAAPVTTTAPSPAAAASAATMPAIKRFATRFFEEALGPDADAFTVKIEKASNAAELMALLERYRDVIRQLKGAAKAEQFWTRVQAMASGGD